MKEIIKTRLIKTDNPRQAVESAAKVLRAGGLCALPTETVYGLAANALDEAAVKKIYRAKGRPSDNPLIVHIAGEEQLHRICRIIPESAKRLCDRFWPGPLTLVLEKAACIPRIVSGGLDTVAVRMPKNETMRAVINACGFPLAAPSANRSGSPSPTKAEHVLSDLAGRIDLILDDGPCDCGVESTVLSLCGPVPCILRPGAVTLEEIRAILPDARLDSGILAPPERDLIPSSPGMKYKHYAPNTRLILVKGESGRFLDFVNAKKGDKTFALCFDEDINSLCIPFVSLGPKDDPSAHARNLYDALRTLDERGASTAYVKAPDPAGVGLAVYNRLLRAAAFEVITI